MHMHNMRWRVLRWHEGATTHGRAAWLRSPAEQMHPPGWTDDPALALAMPRDEAERRADDWNSFAATRGRPERYRAEPILHTQESRHD